MMNNPANILMKGVDVMFINISNHPSSKWNEEQLNAARELGGEVIVDIQFPNVPSAVSGRDIEYMAIELVNDVYFKIEGSDNNVAMVQGESTLATTVIAMLQDFCGIKVVAACSDRNVEEIVLDDGTVKKNVIFKFIQFREYPRLSKWAE